MMLSICVFRYIYIAYDPNEEDVLSFMGVFVSNGEGKIELKNL